MKAKREGLCKYCAHWITIGENVKFSTEGAREVVHKRCPRRDWWDFTAEEKLLCLREEVELALYKLAKRLGCSMEVAAEIYRDWLKDRYYDRVISRVKEVRTAAN